MCHVSLVDLTGQSGSEVVTFGIRSDAYAFCDVGGIVDVSRPVSQLDSTCSVESRE